MMNKKIDVYYRKCAVDGCLKPCKEKNMIGSMFGRQYFCDEHYDEICSASTHKGVIDDAKQ